MDLRELRAKINEICQEAESLSVDVFVNDGEQLAHVTGIYVDDMGDIIIETE